MRSLRQKPLRMHLSIPLIRRDSFPSLHRLKEVEDENNIFEELHIYQNLFRKSGPRDRSTNLHGRRMGAIVREIQGGDLLQQISLVPETSLRFEFPYRIEMPHLLRGLTTSTFGASCMSSPS